MLAPMPWIWFRTYCLPVRPTVTTRIREAVPMTIPRAVRVKRILFRRKVSRATPTISDSTRFLWGRGLPGILLIRLLTHQLRFSGPAGARGLGSHPHFVSAPAFHARLRLTLIGELFTWSPPRTGL